MASPLPIHEWQPEPPVSGQPTGQLRCLWYDTTLADTLAVMDEFLHTAVGGAALAAFCLDRRGSRIPRVDARSLIDAVGVAAARVRG